MKTRILKAMAAVMALTVLGFFTMSFTSAPQQQKGKPWEIPAKYKNMKNPHAGDKSIEALGKAGWAKHCKSCHGNKGLGDGPKAKALKTFPGDFSAKEFQARTDGEIYYMSFIGRDEMPNFEKKITTEEERWAIVNLIRTMK